MMRIPGVWPVAVQNETKYTATTTPQPPPAIAPPTQPGLSQSASESTSPTDAATTRNVNWARAASTTSPTARLTRPPNRVASAACRPTESSIPRARRRSADASSEPKLVVCCATASRTARLKASLCAM